MINWLNGHNPGFKAMVNHDGIFSTTDAFYTTEEVWFPLQYDTIFSQVVQADYNSEMMGSPIDNRAGYENWNPANHVAEWSTPTMIIHSGKDFRLVDGQGIGESTQHFI
jgi:dipeptidyl aminopeptidase/acylaminoacyl peptidase